MKKRKSNRVTLKKNVKEEISMELAELGNLQPKQEPMTPNHRETAEKDRHY
ncbi:hypothetical protein ORD22_06765 [Sporosarcina sp. GW1-11]|uniref:hypothetical protein n=1 Tax=Sporosarcina sp. GW1-11 TaxID=2899126 RepID=UPI00294D00CD|nr:hypothetical protein [Sporosarcina sp. GW1-11]MDV6377964.1 hypothetical protein [Sporosarcina sp. GW1-11]